MQTAEASKPLQVSGHIMINGIIPLWDRSQLNPTCTHRISLILTLGLGFASALWNIKDILLTVGFNQGWGRYY